MGTIRIAIVGSGISAMAFLYSLSRHLYGNIKVIVVAGEECGMENNIKTTHGHQAATNFMGLGGTSKIWGGFCKPYPRNLHDINTDDLEDVKIACDFLGVSFAIDEWKNEKTYNGLEENFFERGFFAASRDISNFWDSHANIFSKHIQLTVLRNTSCIKIRRHNEKWALDLSGVNCGTSLDEIDYIFIAAGVFHTASLISASEIKEGYKIQNGADHRMGVIGTIQIDKRTNLKSLLPSWPTGKYAIIGKFSDYSFTLYIHPSLPFKITDSRGQDRVLAISLARRPLDFVLKFGIKRALNPLIILNLFTAIFTYFFGSKKYDVLYISEEKIIDDVNSQMCDDLEMFQQFQKFLTEKLQGFGQYTPGPIEELQSELRSAIHKTSTVLKLPSNQICNFREPVIVDASALHKTCSFNPSLEMCINAARVAKNFARVLKSLEPSHVGK